MTPSSRLRQGIRIARAVGFTACLLIVGAGLRLAVTSSSPPPVDPDAVTTAPLPERPFTVEADELPAVAVPQLVAGDGPDEAPPAPDVVDDLWRGSCSWTLGPSQLVIPDLCIAAPLVDTTRPPQRELRIPNDVDDVGVWDEGAPLAGADGQPEPSGTTLMVGHVAYASQGRGALYDLFRVRPGMAVYATDQHGTVTRWRISSLTSMPKDQLPTSLFDGPAGPRQLALVTCGGPTEVVDGHRTFRDNVVALAIPDPTVPLP